MSNGSQQFPADVYGSFAGGINQECAQKWLNTITIGINGGVQRAHILFQSSGGTVPDGIFLFNYFRSLPIELCLYNVGTVASIATLAYLGGHRRYVSASATFLLHRTQGSAQSANADRLKALTKSVAMDDHRIETILRQNLNMPNEYWDIHRVSDLWLTAEQAIAIGLATEIREFSAPAGSIIFNI